LILLALRQTAGRGRRGAAWFSPPGESLAFSILVHPDEPKALWPRLALAAGLAVAEAVDSFGPPAGIKWPNDVWIAGRKVAGILVEAGRDFAIVGIGLNVNSEVFPGEISSIATSLRMETGAEHSRAEVLGAIIQRFAVHRRAIGQDFAEIMDGVRARCVLTGRHVSFLTAQGTETGVVEGLADGGELLVNTAGVSRRLIQADEIRILA
jgi:BirA family biotin operon repressor/biotin-[acetyl-CoA-carboxylase] ligase